MKPEFLFLIPLLVTGAILQFTPLFTRPGIYFSATVDPSFPQSDDGRRLLRSYRLQVALWTVLALGLALMTVAAHPATIVALALLLVAGSCFSYWLKFREVHDRYGRPVPNVRYAQLTPASSPAESNLWLCAPPFVWIIGVAAYLQAQWDILPERFPVHWGVDGQPNGWATRSFGGVYGPLLAAFLVDGFCLLLAMALLLLSRNTTMRHVTITILLLVTYPVSFAFGMVALLPLTTFPMWLVPAVTLTFVTVIIVWSVRKIISPAAHDVVPEPSNDAYWKAGLFYFNPDDPAIFVSKRVGIGYTMNFANKLSWVVLAGTLLVVLLPLLLVRAH